MDEDVIVGIPVSQNAAELLRDEDRVKAVGTLVSNLLQPSSPELDPLATLIHGIKAEARADGLTDDDIDAELAAYNAERRF